MPSSWEQSVEGHSLQHGKSAGFMPMGNVGRVLLKLFILCFQRLLSVLQPHLSTQEVHSVSVCSTSPLALALKTVLHICGVPSPVLNEDPRPLVSILVLAMWKRHIRETSFTVVC